MYLKREGAIAGGRSGHRVAQGSGAEARRVWSCGGMDAGRMKLKHMAVARRSRTNWYKNVPFTCMKNGSDLL